ncbi:MAG TPA: DUF5686 and carboxypeptidase regulatory-like domain-containing protein [Cyclobacteriaceae bacterium]
MTHPRFLIFLGFVLAAFSLSAQGIRGIVTSDDGKPLSFATIYVKQLGTGTTTNAEGHYDILCPAGEYYLVFQFLGYETQEKKITVTQGVIELNVVLKNQAIVLRSAIVNANNEDPAYTIMRKAIAKAKYHTQQLDSYSAQVYMKGTGKLVDYPWLAKKMIEKEGIKKNQAFVSESVSEIKYTRPNKFEEKVISIRSDGKDNNTSPTGFINGSFYEPIIAETVSPLSPAAFGYYKFEYRGTFPDREYQVSEIKVTPRLRGDNVVEGTIFIVEDWWSIHSLDLTTTKLGVTIGVKQVYAPVEDKAWLPVSNQFKIQGRFFGFEFVYDYLATMSKYKIQLNPKLVVPQMEVIDEKIEKKEAKAIEKKNSNKKTQDLQERLASGKEITRKELKEVMKEMEKEELKQQKEPEVISNTTFKIDSGAYKSDSVYWTQIRPVPLSTEEVIGYKKMDSLAVEERKKEEGDTIQRQKNNKKGFQPWDILIGDTYKISKHSNLQIKFPLVWFNTVEGFNLIYGLNYGISLQDSNRTRINISPTFRYAFSREKASGKVNFTLRNRKYRLEVEGGRYVSQFNPDEPILPVVNTFMTLFLEENLMKIYERDYIDVLYRKRINTKYSFETNFSWAERRELTNNTNYKWVNRDKIEGYTPNAPVNLEVDTTSFATHQSFIGSVAFTARPWLKFRIRNGRKSEIDSSSPTLSLLYRKGFNSILLSDIDFDQVEVGVKHSFKNGVRGRVDLNLRAGMFLNSDSLAFMDYKHFIGNRTPFSTTDPAGSFRLMDYYLFSTADKYFAANVHYNFRRFLVTSIYEVRMLGIRENVFVNYLATPTSKNYTELGYSIDGILRIFRLEGAVAFRDGKYLDYGFRIGIATNIAVRFSDN